MPDTPDFNAMTPEKLTALRRELKGEKKRSQDSLKVSLPQALFTFALFAMDAATVYSYLSEGEYAKAFAASLLGIALLTMIAVNRGILKASAETAQDRIDLLDEENPAVNLNTAINPDRVQTEIEKKIPNDPSSN